MSVASRCAKRDARLFALAAGDGMVLETRGLTLPCETSRQSFRVSPPASRIAVLMNSGFQAAGSAAEKTGCPLAHDRRSAFCTRF